MPVAGSNKHYHHGDLGNALLEAAGQLLVEKGAAGLSLREVAKLAGVSHAAPYRHYRDKAALLRALARRGFDRLATAIATAGSKPQNPEQKLVEAGVAYVRLAVQNPALTQLMFGGTVVPPLDGDDEAAQAAAFGALLGIIREGVALGTFRQREPRELTLAAWACMHGMAMLAAASLIDITAGSDNTLDEQVRAVARNVIYGIAT